VVRLELTPLVPQQIRKLLVENWELMTTTFMNFEVCSARQHYFRCLKTPRPELRDPPFSPATPPQLSPQLDIFSAISTEDRLLHLPYESFTPVVDLVRKASEDPDVLAIKMTLYRAGSNPELIRSLIAAAESGKEVTVCVELKARFDEQSNIAWARALEHAGVHVFYRARGLKTHAKVLMVVRREGDRINRYVHMSTGNYNATTARIYTDLAFFTPIRKSAKMSLNCSIICQDFPIN